MVGLANLNDAEVLDGHALIAHVAGREGSATWWGAQAYFWSRVVYIPLYASGVGIWRSVVWGVSVVGLVMVLAALV